MKVLERPAAAGGVSGKKRAAQNKYASASSLSAEGKLSCWDFVLLFFFTDLNDQKMHPASERVACRCQAECASCNSQYVQVREQTTSAATQIP